MKPCPFCAEPIQEAAIKCRFCGSMLNGEPGADGAALAPRARGEDRAGGLGPSALIYEGAPSWKAWFWSYIAAGVLSLVVVGLFWLGALHLRRKGLRYKITERTIDYESGVFSKRIETVQLWRVQDIDFRQSMFERMLGVACIHVLTTDKSAPEVVLRGLPASREIFERLKDAAEIARRQRVMGIME